MLFFLISQGSLNPKIWFLGQKVCPVARGHTDRHADTIVTTVGTLSGFQEFFLQPIIKDWSNYSPNIISFKYIDIPAPSKCTYEPHAQLK